MKIVRLVLLPACAALCLAQAPDPKDAKVEELFRLTQLDKLLGQSLAMTRNQFQTSAMQQLSTSNLTPKQRQILTDFQDSMMQLLSNTLAWEKMEPEMVKLYAQAFTAEELDSAIAFYRSPAGQTMVQKTPRLMTEATAITQHHLQSMQVDLKRMLDDLRVKLDAAAAADPKSN